jgi:nucleotide-binding universal stress UspA family protein
MQPLVIAIDFSNTSIHAVEYAIPLANKLKSDIILVWVDKLAPSEGLYTDITNENRIEAKKRFDDLSEKYGKLLGKGLKLEYKLRKGKIHHEVDNLARNVGASLVISGTHGTSGFEEFWIGSNAFKIVTYATCPVITVRQDFQVRKEIKKILVPIDSSAETLQKLPFLTKLAILFNTEIHLMITHYSHLKSIQRVAENYGTQAEKYLIRNKIKPKREIIVSSNITKAVIEYATTNKVDLISIMTEQETPANILLGPHAQQLVNQSPIPVISFHPQEQFCL